MLKRLLKFSSSAVPFVHFLDSECPPSCILCCGSSSHSSAFTSVEKLPAAHSSLNKGRPSNLNVGVLGRLSPSSAFVIVPIPFLRCSLNCTNIYSPNLYLKKERSTKLGGRLSATEEIVSYSLLSQEWRLIYVEWRGLFKPYIQTIPVHTFPNLTNVRIYLHSILDNAYWPYSIRTIE